MVINRVRVLGSGPHTLSDRASWERTHRDSSAVSRQSSDKSIMAEEVESNKVISCYKCSLEYVSVACNRTPLCVDWGKNGWVAYGACYSIALYCPRWVSNLFTLFQNYTYFVHVHMRRSARILNLRIIG